MILVNFCAIYTIYIPRMVQDPSGVYGAALFNLLSFYWNFFEQFHCENGILNNFERIFWFKAVPTVYDKLSEPTRYQNSWKSFGAFITQFWTSGAFLYSSLEIVYSFVGFLLTICINTDARTDTTIYTNKSIYFDAKDGCSVHKWFTQRKQRIAMRPILMEWSVEFMSRNSMITECYAREWKGISWIHIYFAPAHYYQCKLIYLCRQKKPKTSTQFNFWSLIFNFWILIVNTTAHSIDQDIQ